MGDRYLIPHTKRVHILHPKSYERWWQHYLCGLGVYSGDKEITTKRIPEGTQMCKRCAAIAKKREAEDD